jgi:hypothetical protein
LVFLLALFAGDPSPIERWRYAYKKARMKDFSPMKVREALDARDGFTSKKRFEMYELFSELAGHPNMKSSWMMRPRKDGDAIIGPFMEATALEASFQKWGGSQFRSVSNSTVFFLQTGNKVCRHVSPSSN